VRVEVPPELRARGDASRLEQIFLNFLMNANHAIRKAIEEGRPRPHSVTLSSRAEGAWVVLEVSDTGCGIAPENMKRLFQPFFTTKQVGEGTGLGLAIVAQLMREMEGEISCDSEPGVGTTFRITLRAVS
jgi:signal transduction histidine kinase